MNKEWINACFILLAMLAMFSIIGTLEKLPPEAERQLELARHGIENTTILAGDF